ncbi:hypothetical protein AA313_de0208526 [Arthrobotrys entomopaga]|nr:hypothetical protein AA313_de0208526 [Arthrobotrys entomopaga]
MVTGIGRGGFWYFGVHTIGSSSTHDRREERLIEKTEFGDVINADTVLRLSVLILGIGEVVVSRHCLSAHETHETGERLDVVLESHRFKVVHREDFMCRGGFRPQIDRCIIIIVVAP